MSNLDSRSIFRGKDVYKRNDLIVIDQLRLAERRKQEDM